MVVVGLDLGGTRVKAALVDKDGVVLASAVTASGESQGRAAWERAARVALDAVMECCQSRPLGLGLSVPGAVDPSRAVLCDLVARLPDGAGLDLAELFGSYGLPVASDNDARAALAAERRWGNAVGLDDVVMLTLGTGLGGAALVDARVPGGDPILAGNQLGHLTIHLDGPICVCGNRGCAELYASATGLVRVARLAGMDTANAETVFGLDRQGASRAGEVIERFIDALAAVTVNAIHAYQPQLIVLAGGVMRSAERILPGLRQRVDQRAWTIPRRRVAIEVTKLGDSIGVLGAAAVAFASCE